MKKLALISALAMAGLFGPPAHAAGTTWFVNGHTYEYVSDAVTWSVANAAAQAAGGYLATVTSAAENSFIASTVTNGALAWLGGTDSGYAVNDWHWVGGPDAGQAFSYTNWNGGEPNNCCGGEDYLQINWAVQGGWNDHGGPGANAGQANGYVIEYAAAVPEPGASAMLLAGLASLVMVRRRRTR